MLRCFPMFLRAAPILFAAIFATAALAQAPLAGTWTLRDGRQFGAELLAADGLRATFGTGSQKVVVGLSDLGPQDAEKVRSWRAGDFRAPLVDPAKLAPWPAQAAPEPVEVKLISEDAGTFTYESAHFRMISDVKLPASAVREIATVFEATRAVLIAIPLGLHAGGEREKYPVLLLGSGEAYAAAGGPPGSGGYYEGRTRRMLVLLPNLGIEQKGGVVQANHAGSLFVLKHEVTHQLLSRWNARLPMWLYEGLAEYVASLPYSQGRYTLRNPGAGMRDYLLKWRKGKDDRSIRLIPATQLMKMEGREWREAVQQQAAYDLYNSAALLTWHFIQQEGGSSFASYLAAMRRGREPAMEELLRGRTLEQVSAEVAAMARKMGLEVQ